jgi:hypothetical protein
METKLYEGIPVHNGSLFTWHGKVGVCDLSDLNILNNDCLFRKISRDPSDYGFYVRSPRTGVMKLFVLKTYRTFESSDWDDAMYDFVCDEGGFMIKIFND